MARGRSAVRDLQDRLATLGYDVGEIDGVFGEGVRIAVERFQHDRKPEVTGVVGRATARELGF